MMGIKERAFAPIVNLSLEDLVPADHFYRHLERTLDLSFVRDLVYDFYAAGGRPSIDPIVFFKLQLIMFFEGIRSERQLMRVVADRLSLLWYLGYDLTEPLPDHSSLTRIRERYGLQVFRRFFETIVERCQQAGLVWGRELYFDATKVEANASVDSAMPRFAVEAHLAELFSPQGEVENDGTEAAPEPLPVPVSADKMQELVEANGQRHDWIAQDGRPDRSIVRHFYQRISDFKASTTDPDASLMHRVSGGAHFGYHDHYVVDGGRARIILGVLVTPFEVMENIPMLDLLWRVRFRWRLFPRQVTGDTTYGTTENIVAVENEGIRACVPLPNFDSRTLFYGQSRFTYDAERDVYVCPQGQDLSFDKNKYTERVRIYQARPEVCNACSVKAQCTESQNGRLVKRSFDEAYLDRVRSYHETEAFKKAMRKRKVWVEPLFGEAKEWHGLRRFRLGRLPKVNIEALMTAMGQNLKRLVKRRGWGRRPWPTGTAGMIPNSFLIARSPNG